MLRPDRTIERIFLHRAPMDMRRQIDGLAILARDVIREDPLSGAMFAFVNARRNKLKILKVCAQDGTPLERIGAQAVTRVRIP